MTSLTDFIYESTIEEAAEGETYVVYREGGSIGEGKHCNARVGSKHVSVVQVGLDRETAMSERKAFNKCLSPGDKKYYRIKYSIAPESKVHWDSDEKKEEVIQKQKEREERRNRWK